MKKSLPAIFPKLIAAIVAATALGVIAPKVYPNEKELLKAWTLAEKESKPLVIFVGIAVREVDGCRCIAVEDLNGKTDAGVHVIADPSQWEVVTAWLPADADSSRIRNAANIEDGSVEALDELNAIRARSGLRPYIRDDGLTDAAKAAARFRADRGIAGHTSNDFGFVPSGSSATAAGCAAWPEGMGFGACCTHENWTYAGAASCRGRDGRLYHHLYVR